MPTNSLLLLHQLLCALYIPIIPSTVSSTSPSLLLIVLETLLKYRLPLPSSIRLCATPDDELAVIKCILGVLADDILGMDLTVIDPLRVVQGSEAEIAVMIMAMAVIAKRSGVRLSLPLAESIEGDLRDDSGDRPETSWELGPTSPSNLPMPMLPDHSFSVEHQSDPPSPLQSDVFGSGPPSSRYVAGAMYGLQRMAKQPAGLHSQYIDFQPFTTIRATRASTYDDDRPASGLTSTSASGGAAKKRTVLQDMLEEFGLG
jgi:hypothetical protein